MTKHYLFSALYLLTLTASTSAHASQMTYKPINPSFGGNSFNGSFLQANADAQNDNEKPSKGYDAMENFSSTITSSIIGRVASNISDAILGEEGQDSGMYTVGDNTITFNREGQIIHITIKNNANGQSTSVDVPVGTY